MSIKIKTVVINAAKKGYNLPEIALYLIGNRNIVANTSEYLQFIEWAKNNEQFYYWLRSRLNANYRG